jgi:hypothetical protein
MLDLITVAYARSEPLDLDRTAERKPNSQYCGYSEKLRESHSGGYEGWKPEYGTADANAGGGAGIGGGT